MSLSAALFCPEARSSSLCLTVCLCRLEKQGRANLLATNTGSANTVCAVQHPRHHSQVFRHEVSAQPTPVNPSSKTPFAPV